MHIFSYIQYYIADNKYIFKSVCVYLSKIHITHILDIIYNIKMQCKF